MESLFQSEPPKSVWKELDELTDEINESTVNNPWAMDSLLVDLQFIFISFVCLTGIPGQVRYFIIDESEIMTNFV